MAILAYLPAQHIGKIVLPMTAFAATPPTQGQEKLREGHPQGAKLCPPQSTPQHLATDPSLP